MTVRPEARATVLSSSSWDTRGVSRETILGPRLVSRETDLNLAPMARSVLGGQSAATAVRPTALVSRAAKQTQFRWEAPLLQSIDRHLALVSLGMKPGPRS